LSWVVFVVVLFYPIVGVVRVVLVFVCVFGVVFEFGVNVGEVCDVCGEFVGEFDG